MKILLILSALLFTSCLTTSVEDRCMNADLSISSLHIRETAAGKQLATIQCEGQKK